MVLWNRVRNMFVVVNRNYNGVHDKEEHRRSFGRNNRTWSGTGWIRTC
jgi:hypothetical protein